MPAQCVVIIKSVVPSQVIEADIVVEPNTRVLSDPAPPTLPVNVAADGPTTCAGVNPIILKGFAPVAVSMKYRPLTTSYPIVPTSPVGSELMFGQLITPPASAVQVRSSVMLP